MSYRSRLLRGAAPSSITRFDWRLIRDAGSFNIELDQPDSMGQSVRNNARRQGAVALLMGVIDLIGRVFVFGAAGAFGAHTTSHYGYVFIHLFDYFVRFLGLLAVVAVILFLFIGVARSVDDAEIEAKESWREIKIEGEVASSQHKRITGVYAQVRPSAAGFNPTLYRRRTLVALGFLPSYILIKWIYCSLNVCRERFLEHLIKDPIFMFFAGLAVAAYALVVWCSFELKRNGVIAQGTVVGLLNGKHVVYSFDVGADGSKRRFKCRDLAEGQAGLGIGRGKAISVRYSPRFPRVSQLERGRCDKGKCSERGSGPSAGA